MTRRLECVGNADVLISTHLDREHAAAANPFVLRGDEGVVLRCVKERA